MDTELKAFQQEVTEQIDKIEKSEYMQDVANLVSTLQDFAHKYPMSWLNFGITTEDDNLIEYINLSDDFTDCFRFIADEEEDD